MRQQAKANRKPALGRKKDIVYVLTVGVPRSADIGLLTNFPTRGLPKAALVLTNACHE